MDRNRWVGLLRNCNRSLLSFQLYASHQYSERGSSAQELESLVLREVPVIVRDRVETYAKKSVIPQESPPIDQIFLEKDVLKTISACFQVDLEEAGRIFRGFNYLREGGFIIRFTNTDDQFLSRKPTSESLSTSGDRCVSKPGPDSGGVLDCFFSDVDLMSKVYDFVLQEQLALLDSVKFMYENASFEKDCSGFEAALRKACFGEVLWGRDLDHSAKEPDGKPGSAFNLLDELWRWYCRLVSDRFVDFDSPEMERIFGGPLLQGYSRLLLESNLLHTMLVVLQAQKAYFASLPATQRRQDVDRGGASAPETLSRASPLNRCQLIISELQTRCFLGSLYTLYSPHSGIGVGQLTLCDNGLAHSASLIDQLRQTASNGVLLASSSLLSLSPKELALRNEDLGFLISVVITLLESLCSNESGEVLCAVQEETHSFSTPARARAAQLASSVQKQLFVRGNLLLVHAKVVKPLLPAFIFSYASIVVQTPNRDSLLAPVLNTPAFFQSCAFSDSLENLLHALSSQHPLRQYVSVSLLSDSDGETGRTGQSSVHTDQQDSVAKGRGGSIVLGESFGTYYQYLVLYSIIRNTISTFSLKALPFVARISKHLSSLLRKEPRLVFRECWRGDYFRQIGVHLIIELFMLSFPYGVVEFLDLLTSLVPDFSSLPKLSPADVDMAKQSFKLLMTFLRTPIRSVSFPPYLSSLGLSPIPVSHWSPDSVRSDSEPPELPLHLEVSRLETPDLALGASFSQVSLSGTLEGCLLDFLEIRLGDVTPLSAGFPSARKCLTPLRVLPVGVAHSVPLKSLIAESSETSFSSPLWTNSPYGTSFDFPEAEMPPYYHIHSSRGKFDERERSRPPEEDYSPLDINRLRLPGELSSSSAEIKLGELDPFTIRFSCKNVKNPDSLPSLLKILLLVWESIGLSLSQQGANPIKPHIEMLVSLNELIYRIVSFNKSVIFVLDQEIFSWNALVPSASSHQGPKISSRFGLLTIKTLQMLKGVRSLMSNKTNGEEIMSVALHTLPRLVGLLRISLQPIDMLSIDDAINGNFLKLQISSVEPPLSAGRRPAAGTCDSLPPWSHKSHEIPMYWLVPLLITCTSSNSLLDPASQRDVGHYSPLLKGIQGFGLDELFGLASKSLEVVEKQLKSYPITAQVLEFAISLLSFCPASFWGLGWDRHARLLLTTLGEYSYSSPTTNKIIRDIQLLINDCIIYQHCSEETEQQRDLLNLFGRISHFSIHTVLSRISSWQLNIESERNLLLLRSLSVFGLLLGSLDSATLVKSNEDYERIRGKSVRPEAKDGGVYSLKEIIPSISGVASSNHRATIATLLKHVTETGLIPSLLALLSCEYSIHSQSFRRSRYSQMARDELNDIPAPWELLISNSMVSQAMERNETLSCVLALRLQHSNSQVVFLDRLLVPPFECSNALSDRSGELFSSPDVIVAQQVVTKVLEVVQKLLNSVADLQTSSELLCSLRTALAQWILSSSPSPSPYAPNCLLDSPKFSWSDSDMVAQHIHSRISLLYLSKKPVMNLVKSLFSLMLSFVPCSMPPDTPIIATRLLSSFCHTLSLESSAGSGEQSQPQGSKSDVILEQILKPSSSLDSIQQDFLLSLTNTRLFPLLIKLLHQELDFVLLAPIFSFLRTFDFLEPKAHRLDKTPIEICRAVLELINLFSASHPSTLIGPTGSFSLERLDHVLTHCRSNLTVRSGSPTGGSPPSSISRIGLICHAIVGILEKANLLLENANKTHLVVSPNLLHILSLIPLSLSLLNQLFENTRSRDFLIKEMLRHTKDIVSSPAATSIWTVIISLTRNLTSAWNCLQLEGDIPQAQLQLLTIISSSVACVYHLTSRFISITTHLSFKNYNKLPVFLRERKIFDFVKFLVSDGTICEILYSSKSSRLVSNLFLKSNGHFAKIQDKLGIPIRYCIFSQNGDSETSRSHQNLPENSLEQFVNKYYYERYLKFSYLVISNESFHSLTEFDLCKISEYRDENARGLRSSSFDPSNQAFKLPPSSSSETSQLATLEMVWESGQLLAPKQHFSSPSSPGLEKKEGAMQAGGGDAFLKHSVVSSRIKERPETAMSLSTSRKDASNASKHRTTESSPSLLSLRNSSFVHKTRQWGPEFELDVSAMLVLLSCSTAACISVPHSEMDTQALIAFSRELILQIRQENSSRSFLESFMYLLSGYNELIFYLKTLLPVVIAKFSNLVEGSFLSELAVLFDSTKLSIINHCIDLSQKEDHLVEPDVTDWSPKTTPLLEDLSSPRRKQSLLPNLMMTILFSTCTDLLTFDIVSSVRLILGRAEMIETQNSLKHFKSPAGPSSGEKSESCSLSLFPIAPNSPSVCLSSSWQDCDVQGLRSSTSRATSKETVFRGFVGNVISYIPVSEFSEESQRSNIRRLFPVLIEKCCKYMTRNLKTILSHEGPLPCQNRGGSCEPNFDLKHIWTIHSLQTSTNSLEESRSTQESDICLSCDLTAALYLLLFVLKQLSFLSDAEDCAPILESSTVSSLLELTSSSIQFYKRNGKVIHRIANEARGTGSSSCLLNLFSSSLIALPILCLCIPAQILEVMYLDNRKKLLRDISSEFTMNACSMKSPVITKIKEMLASIPLLDEFNLDMAVKVVPTIDSVIQLNLACIDRKEAPSFSYQQAIARKGRLDSIGFLKPLKVPFMSWSEAAYHSTLASTMSCLAALSSTAQGCMFILRSGILVQIASNFFLGGFGPSSALTGPKQSCNNLDSSSKMQSFWPSTYLSVGPGDQTIRNPMHILWCKLISLATIVFASLAKAQNTRCQQSENSVQNAGLNSSAQGGTEYRHPTRSKFTEKMLSSHPARSLSTVARRATGRKTEEGGGICNPEPLVRDDSQAREGVLKFIQAVEPRIKLILSEQRQISHLASLEEFGLGIDLIRAAIALNIPELRLELTETLRKSLRTIRSISVVSLGRGITEAFDLFKPTSRAERVSAGQSTETLNLYHLDSLPAQVPSIFHQRCCVILLNSIRSIIDTFVSESGFSLELRGCRELLMQLFHDTMDLGRPILQLLEDIPNHCYSVFTIVKSKDGESFLPLSLNIQALNPWEPSIADLIPEYKNAFLSKNNVEFRGIARISAITESCCLPEMITFSSFVHLLSSLVDIIAICGAKCLYTLESLEASDQHNDTIRRFLEFLHLSQGLNSSSLLNSSRKLIEKVYASLKSKLGDQINVEVVGLVGIKKDPIHALLFDRLSNTNNSVNSGI